MSDNNLGELTVPKNAGPELDVLLAMHMGWKHWSGNELPIKMHLEEISNYPAGSIPKFSTDHNAFFEHVASYFINLDMGFEAHYLIEDQMWQVDIEVGSKTCTGKDYELPHAGSLAAISALQVIKKG